MSRVHFCIEEKCACSVLTLATDLVFLSAPAPSSPRSLDTLSEMISIGTLLAFTTVCLGVVILRFQPPAEAPHRPSLLLLVFLALATGFAV